MTAVIVMTARTSVSAFTELPRAGPQRAVAVDSNPEFVQIFRNSDHYGSSRDQIDRCLHRFRKLHDDSSASFGVVPLANTVNDEENDIVERFYNRCFTEVDTACIQVQFTSAATLCRRCRRAVRE